MVSKIELTVRLSYERRLDLLPRFCIKLSPRLEVVSHISRDTFTLHIPCFAFQRDCVAGGGQLWTLVSLRGIPCNLLLSDLSMRTTTTNTIMHSQSSGTCPSWSPPSCSPSCSCQISAGTPLPPTPQPVVPLSFYFLP